MKLKILKTKKDYQAALERFEEIFQAKPGSSESDEADVLSLLLKEYEEKNFVIEAPDPLEAIRYRMEQQGLTNSDLAGILGFKSRVTDIFNKHRKLNLGMVRRLHDRLNIPLETLVKEY
ncbi:MAG: helix-turn-helix domain-containing protein [Cyclobacteriaceae bacterium]|nr:helix-turn-helix domain-containing protein [Cyclobacteriaceae bacterium]